MIDEILADFTASFWLKNALQSALSRDPLDAVRDAEVLVIALRERCNEMFIEELSND